MGTKANTKLWITASVLNDLLDKIDTYLHIKTYAPAKNKGINKTPKDSIAEIADPGKGSNIGHKNVCTETQAGVSDSPS